VRPRPSRPSSSDDPDVAGEPRQLRSGVTESALMGRRTAVAVACLLGCVTVLTGCRVDVRVGVEMAENGSGTLSVTIVADAGVIDQAPGLLDDVAVGDLVAAGWTVEGPTPTDSGGATLVLRRTFDTPTQATELLGSLNGPAGPLRGFVVARLATDNEVRLSVDGTLQYEGGVEGFADGELVGAVGFTPWADEIAASNQSLGEALGVTLFASLEGKLDAAATTGVTNAGLVQWAAPFDGTATVVQAESVVSLERGGAWRALSGLFLVLLIAWIALAVAVIVLVMRARAVRRRRALRAMSR
jgi:hypothetical protein